MTVAASFPSQVHRILGSAFALCTLVSVASATAQAPREPGVRVPAGFEITEFAGSDLANDIYSLTFDPKGRAVVSGRGYIRILADEDGDGRADRALDFADGPDDGAQGLYWEHSELFVTGDGGLRRYHDRDGDDRADGPSELIQAIKTGGEHDAHDIRRGSDGWLYLLCGNMAGASERIVPAPSSPIRHPIAGCIVRFAPDFASSEIVADGFRNAYRMDFSAQGDLFTYDSDNERCVALPWYEPTRLYRVRAGGHYGWRSPHRGQFWRMPPYFPDVVAPVAYVGRGSPTGLAAYRHRQFPAEYRDGLFLADWTFGRVYFAPLDELRSSQTLRPRVFLEAIGESGFAPTDLAVHPRTGDLWISIGGRGTRGGVFRVRYLAGAAESDRDWTAPAIARSAALSGAAGAARRPAASLAEVLQSDPGSDANSRLAWVRQLQWALGDVGAKPFYGTIWEGYTAGTDRAESHPADQIAELGRRVCGLFPSQHAPLDFELSRTLAMIEHGGTDVIDCMAARLGAATSPVDEIHYLTVLARLRGDRAAAITERVAGALLGLDRKCDALGLARDRHWPLRVAELYAELARKDPSLSQHIIEHPEFGRADHVIFAQAPGFDRTRAARTLLAHARAATDFAWTAGMVQLVDTLPEAESRPVLRELWDQMALRDAIVLALADAPEAIDRGLFIQGLGSAQLNVVAQCLDALERLAAGPGPNDLAALVQAARRLREGKEELRLRERVGALLQSWTGQSIEPGDAAAWSDWFVRAYPDYAARVAGDGPAALAAWRQRLATIEWAAGDAERGRTVYQRTGCQACHSGPRALGPDLRGVASRFSRDDVFTAIVQPSRDVSPRYQTTLVATEDGRVHQGAIIYEAVDSLILQTGADSTVRITNQQIVERRVTTNSLMPNGLIDGVSDGGLADLWAYLKDLQ